MHNFYIRFLCMFIMNTLIHCIYETYLNHFRPIIIHIDFNAIFIYNVFRSFFYDQGG